MTHVAESGHPDFPLVWNAMCNSDNPAAIAAGFCNHLGLFDRDGAIHGEEHRAACIRPRSNDRRAAEQQDFPEQSRRLRAMLAHDGGRSGQARRRSLTSSTEARDE